MKEPEMTLAQLQLQRQHVLDLGAPARVIAYLDKQIDERIAESEAAAKDGAESRVHGAGQPAREKERTTMEMTIRYGLGYRTYESRKPGVTVMVYASDGDGTILSMDKHSKFSHACYVLDDDITLYELEHAERMIRERWEDRSEGQFRVCEYKPMTPMSREQIIDHFELVAR